MNIEDLLNLAERAMLCCTDHSAYRYTLYLLRGALFCGPTKDLPKDSIKIFPITRDQLKHGLTSVEWIQLSDKLAQIWKELKL